MWMTNFVMRKVSFVTVKQWLVILACTIVGANLFLAKERTLRGQDLNSIQDLNATVNGVVATEKSIHGALSGKSVSEETVNPTEEEKTASYFLPSKVSNDWMKTQATIYQQRNDRIRDVCQRHKVSQGPVLPVNMLRFLPGYPLIDEDPPVERPDRRNAYLLHSLSVLACSLPKVGSSSIVAAFNLANGKYTKQNQKRFSLTPESEDDFLRANETYFKFMFVRHPMDRLLSAYIDKMIVHPIPNLPGFPEKVKQKGQAILAQRAKNSGQKQRRLLGLASQILHSHTIQKPEITETNNSRKDMSQLGEIYNRWEKKQSRNKTKIMAKLDTNSSSFTGPTFEEFLEYVLSTNLHGKPLVEAHWVPYWRQCSPCNIRYHVIGKTETTKEDFTYIWQRTGLDERVPVPWLNKKPVSNEKSRRTHYYASLPRELILRVYQRYHLDFEFFDYSIDDILTQAGYQPISNEEYVKHI